MQFHNFKTHSNNLIYASQLDSVTLVTILNEQNSQQCSTQKTFSQETKCLQGKTELSRSTFIPDLIGHKTNL